MIAPKAAVDAFTFYTTKPDPIARIPAAGIVAVLYSGESGLNPGSQGTQATEHGGALNPNGAYGIASWNGPRQAALAAFATAKNLPVGAVETQLLFVLTEAADSYPEVWAAIQAGDKQTIGNFVTVFVQKYEVPANPTAEIDRSLPLAQALLALSPVPTPVAASDAEIAALGQLWAILAPFQSAAQVRMISYLSSRTGVKT